MRKFTPNSVKGSGVNPVEIAQKQRHLYLLEQVKNNRPLSRKEVEELGKLEGKKQKSKAGGRKSKKKSAEIAPEQLIDTQKQAAEYTGVSTRTVRRWKNEKMPMSADGKYIRAMLDLYKRNEGKETTEEKKRKNVAEADVKEIKAKLLEMELELKQGELVHRSEIERENVRKITAVKRQLLGMGRKIADRLSRLRDPRKIQHVIDTETKEIIGGFAGGK